MANGSSAFLSQKNFARAGRRHGVDPVKFPFI